VTLTKVVILIIAAASLFEIVAVLGLVAAGVEGPILSFGGLVPLAAASLASSSAVARYSRSRDRDESERSTRR
jgi:hypothetical protein